MRARNYLCLLLVLCPSLALAQKSQIVADVSSYYVDISYRFTGTQVLIYGAVDSDFGDVVIVAKGPNQDFAMDKKERFFGIWLKRKTIHYHNVPRFYHIVSARAVDEFASDSASETYKLSLDSLALNGPVDGVTSVEEGLEFAPSGAS